MEINKHNSDGLRATHCANYTISTLHKLRLGKVDRGGERQRTHMCCVWGFYKFHFHALDNYSI